MNIKSWSNSHAGTNFVTFVVVVEWKPDTNNRLEAVKFALIQQMDFTIM